MDLDDYDSIDACLVATSTLTHSSYRQDNTKVFNLLKPLIYSETSRYWQFASQFNQTQDGREAYLAIKRQAEGQSAVEAKKAAAYKAINDARFRGNSTRHTIDDYIATLQKSFNMLASLKEPVAESKKVQDFIRGIQCPALEPALSYIWNSSQLLNSFEACQQYIKTVYDNQVIPRTIANQARVSSTHTRDRGDGRSQVAHGRRTGPRTRRRGNNNNRREYNKSGNLPRIRTGNYSHEEYSKLTDKEKEEVKKLRKEKSNTNVSSTNTKATSKKAETKSTASVSAVTTTPTIVDKPEQITAMACSLKTNQVKITETGIGTTSPTLTLGKSTVNFKNNANFKPYWHSRLYIDPYEKESEKAKRKEIDVTVAAMDTVVTPPPELDIDDIDDEISKITKAVGNDDVDWKSLPRHNTNSPQMFSSHYKYSKNEKIPDLIKKLQNSAWFVTPLCKCDERQKGKRESFKETALYKKLVDWVDKQESNYSKYGHDNDGSSEDDSYSDGPCNNTRNKRPRTSSNTFVRPPNTGPKHRLRNILE
jgi:hypothetical protein